MGSLETLAPCLNPIFGQRCDPQAPLNDTLHGLKAVLGAGVYQAKQALDDTGGSAVTFKVNQQPPRAAVYLGRLLRIIGKVMHIQTYRQSVST